MYGGGHINSVDIRGQLERMAFLLLTSTFWDGTKAISLGEMSFPPLNHIVAQSICLYGNTRLNGKKLIFSYYYSFAYKYHISIFLDCIWLECLSLKIAT